MTHRGTPKVGQCGTAGNTNACKASGSTTNDAARRAIASDETNTFVTWQECPLGCSNAAAWSFVKARKYDATGRNLTAVVTVSASTTTAIRREPDVAAADNSGNVAFTWWEQSTNLSQPEAIVRKVYQNNLSTIVTQIEQVNRPPSAPGGAQRARSPALAIDLPISSTYSIATAWLGNLNHPATLGDDPALVGWNAIGRTHGTGVPGRNDFRADLAPPAARIDNVDVARAYDRREFTVVWRDNRSGYYEVYARKRLP